MRKSAVGAGTKELWLPPTRLTCKLQLAAFLLLLLFTTLAAPSAARAAIAPVEPASDDRGVYLLSEPGHLLWFRDTVNDVSADIDAKLTKDIDLSKGGNPSEWIPVGQYTDKTPNGYAGSFDGGGFTVSGYIVASANVVSADKNGKLALAAGFFGLVGPSAEIRGLTVGGVVSVDISNNTDMIYIHAGGIAGVSYGAITDCANGGGVSASGDGTKYTGGIVGDNYGTIANCDHSGGMVSASDGYYGNNAGGIAGDNIGTISNSCWPASGDLKAIGSDTAVSADVVSLDAAEMQKVVTTVLPVERTLSVGVGGSAPALISYPGRADDMAGYLSVSGDIFIASPDIADISRGWPCAVSGIKPGVTAVSFDIDLRATDFSDKNNLNPLARSCATDPLCFTIAVGKVPVAGVSIDVTELTLDVVANKKLTATVKPDNATDKEVAWTSANPAVAAVDESGKVTALSVGTTVVTAKAVGKSAACTVTVARKKTGGSGSSHGCAACLGALPMLALVPIWMRRKKR